VYKAGNNIRKAMRFALLKWLHA